MQSHNGAGWFTDPQDPHSERYFDGQQWTKHVRRDIPEIPMAPWRDPASAPSTGGFAVDVSAPPARARTWTSLAIGALGVVSVFAVGFTVTSQGIDEMKRALPGIEVQDAPPGTAQVEVVSCDMLPQEVYAMNEQYPSIELDGNFGEVRTLADYQPLSSVPSEPDVAYRVLECEVDAGDASGAMRPVGIDLYLFSDGFGINYYEN